MKQKETDRLAERGEHYYRQRECAICGEVFWPNNSGQKYCGDSCQRQAHNKACMDYYFRKRDQMDKDTVHNMVFPENGAERQEVISA